VLRTTPEPCRSQRPRGVASKLLGVGVFLVLRCYRQPPGCGFLRSPSTAAVWSWLALAARLSFAGRAEPFFGSTTQECPSGECGVRRRRNRRAAGEVIHPAHRTPQRRTHYVCVPTNVQVIVEVPFVGADVELRRRREVARALACGANIVPPTLARTPSLPPRRP
jgi:hypothetical protein